MNKWTRVKFQPNLPLRESGRVTASKEHILLSKEAAKEGMVLLKNEKNILPFLPEKTDSLAIIGPLADVWYKDWYCGIPPYTVTVLDGIKKAYPNTRIASVSGLSRIYLCSGGKYVGMDESGHH